MILIASSISLLVIIAGMFLLAKVQKENLPNMFRYVAYFVVLAGFLNLFGGGIVFVAKKCLMHCAAQVQMDCDRHDDCYKHKKHKRKACSGMGMCEDEGEGMCFEKRIVINGKETDEACAQGEGKECCKDKMMKKDSVVIKK